MPRRGGKAASRRARQRPPRRPVLRQPELGVQTPAPDRITPVATESAEPTPASPIRPTPPARPVYAASSRLSERAAAEYHYVGRDLRNILVLTAIIAVLLVATALVFPALGLVGR